MSGQ
jgi:hypothetical protein